MHACVRSASYIRANGGLQLRGLFRVPGRADAVTEAKRDYNCGVAVEYSDINDAGVYVCMYVCARVCVRVCVCVCVCVC
jgi:hypothetical protein